MSRAFAKNLAAHYRSVGKAAFMADLQEHLDLGSRNEPGGLKPNDFSLRDIAEEFILDKQGRPCGYEFVKYALNPASGVDLQEAIAAVDSSAFRDISGQLLVRSVLDNFAPPALVLSATIPTINTPFTRGEKIPGMALPKDPEEDAENALVVEELQEYKTLGFSAEWTELPATIKRGGIIAISREMIYGDLTGLAIKRAQTIGQILGFRKEKRLADVVIGYKNNYVEKRASMTSATSRNTYYSVADSGAPWINHLDNNDLDDYTALDAADDLFMEMTDPNTGEPIILGARHILHTPSYRSQVERVLNSVQVEQVTNSNVHTYVNKSLVRPGLIPVESVFFYSQLKKRFSLATADARKYWVYGDLTKAFAYFSNWDLQTMQAPANSDAEFRQDIVFQVKASERGEAASVEPRYVQRNRAVSSSSSIGVST